MPFAITYPFAKPFANADSHPVAHPHTETITITYRFAVTYPDADSYLVSVANIYADTHADPNAQPLSDADPNPKAHPATNRWQPRNRLLDSAARHLDVGEL